MKPDIAFRHQDIDEELKTDLMGSFESAFEAIEEGLAELETDDDPALIDELFRSIHSIKGNAAMVHLESVVNYTHQIEHMFSRMREGDLAFSLSLSEAIQVGMDRLRDLHHRELLGANFEHLDEQNLGEKFARLAQCEPHQQQACINDILGISQEEKAAQNDAAERSRDQSPFELSKTQQDTLVFFQELSLQLDKQNEYWEGRSIQCFLWSQKLNQHGGSPVSYEQLAAASYLHDFGMSLLPQSLLQQNARFGKAENEQIRPHPVWGYKLLAHMPGWEEAAEIVLQHHEHEDGQGYPNGLNGEQIHPGAKILAIVDAFVSMTAGRADRSRRRSALRAISEINARKGTQFSEVWVGHFNNLLKSEIRAGRF